MREQPGGAGGERRRQRIAAHRDEPQRARRRGRRRLGRVEQQPQRRRHEDDPRHLMLLEHGEQPLRVARRGRWRHHQRHAARERPERLPQRVHEDGGRLLDAHLAVGKRVAAPHPAAARHEPAARAEHGFGVPVDPDVKSTWLTPSGSWKASCVPARKSVPASDTTAHVAGGGSTASVRMTPTAARGRSATAAARAAPPGRAAGSRRRAAKSQAVRQYKPRIAPPGARRSCVATCPQLAVPRESCTLCRNSLDDTTRGEPERSISVR